MDIEYSDGAIVSKGQVLPRFSVGTTVLNIVLDFCTISCLIDGMTNSWYEYPDVIYLPIDGNVTSSDYLIGFHTVQKNHTAKDDWDDD